MRLSFMLSVGLGLALGCGGSEFTGGGGTDAAAGSGGAAGAAGGGAGTAGGAVDGAAGAGGNPCDCDDDGICEDFTTNPRHCGGCWQNCLGATCQGGRCLAEQFAVGVAASNALTVYATKDNGDDAFVVWAGNNGQILTRAADAQSDPPQALANATNVGGLVVSTASAVRTLYWTTATDGVGDVMSCPIPDPKVACGSPNKVAQEQQNPTLIVGDDGAVYWLNADGGQLLQAVPSGPTVMTTITAVPTALALDADAFYWISDDALWTMPRQSSATPTNLGGSSPKGAGLYVEEGNQIYAAGTLGGSISKFENTMWKGQLEGQYEAYAVVAFGDWVYWPNNEPTSPSVRRIRKADFPAASASDHTSAAVEDYVPGLGGGAIVRSKFFIFFVDQNQNLQRLVM